jgi:hypothetical protein
MLENRDTKIKRVGDKVYVEFYEDNKMIGLVDYSDHSMYYVEDAIENFMTGLMQKNIIDLYKEKVNV